MSEKDLEHIDLEGPEARDVRDALAAAQARVRALEAERDKAIEAREVEIGNDLHGWLTRQYPDFDADTSGEDSADLTDHLKMMFRRALE